MANGDTASKLFEDPDGWWKDRERELEQKYMAHQEAAKREQAFWSELYRRNPDLKGEENLVWGTAVKHSKDLQGITDPNEMAEKIASMSRRELNRIGEKFGGAQRRPRSSQEALDRSNPFVGGPDTTDPLAPSEDPGWSMGSVQRERKEQRRRNEEAIFFKPGMKRSSPNE